MSANSIYTSSPPPRLTGVLDMLGIARESREIDEANETSFDLPISNSRRRISGSSSSQDYRTDPSNSATATQPPSLAGRRRDGVRTYTPPIHYLPILDNEAAVLRRDNDDPAPMSSSSLLRRELDGEDIPNRLSILRSNLRSNAVRIHEALDAAASELTLPFIPTPRDSFPPRNHHRHSSMSSSPRILEATNSPPARSSNRRTESAKEHKLEDVLYFLDIQRLVSANLDKPEKSCHFVRSYVAESSWLRAGGFYHGVQTIAGEVPNILSTLARQLHTTQFVPTKEWKVEVTIDQVDYSDMSIAGLMRAYDMTDCRDRQSVTTFWTGEAYNPKQSISSWLILFIVDRFRVPSFTPH
jgi:hypothetical protein